MENEQNMNTKLNEKTVNTNAKTVAAIERELSRYKILLHTSATRNEYLYANSDLTELLTRPSVMSAASGAYYINNVIDDTENLRAVTLMMIEDGQQFVTSDRDMVPESIRDLVTETEDECGDEHFELNTFDVTAEYEEESSVHFDFVQLPLRHIDADQASSSPVFTDNPDRVADAHVIRQLNPLDAVTVLGHMLLGQHNLAEFGAPYLPAVSADVDAGHLDAGLAPLLPPLVIRRLLR